MSRLALDLTKRHFVYRRGPMLAIGTWLRLDEDGWKPALVLIRAEDEMKEGLIPCFITADKAWVWSEDVGDPVAAAQQAASFCEAMRFTVDPRNMYFIARTVHDLLGDLLSIPPYPVEEVVADIQVTNTETGKSFEVKLIDV